MQVSFNPIAAKDIDQLRHIAIKTFKQSYEHLNTQSNFKWYVDKAFATEKLIAEIQNEESFYYFISLADDIVGYLKLNIGKSQTETHGDEYLEIERIYLDEGSQGKGLGKRMIKHAMDKAIALNKTKVWLGVWDHNPKAIAFYERNGFERKGSHIFKFGDQDQIDIIMEINCSV